MTDTQNADTRQARWARFRFSIIGLLLSSPPEKGELKSTNRSGTIRASRSTQL